jgi:hypothetical protein
MSELKVNKISPRSGTDVTLGDSGDTFTLGSGAAFGAISGSSIALSGNIGLGGATPTTSGTGITFPATASASTNANTLDDYEEGTFTPTFTSTGASFTYSQQHGFYTKIGRSVTCHIFIRAQSSGTTSNALKITGLPFTSINSGSFFSSCSFGQIESIDYPAGALQISGHVGSTATQIDLQYSRDDQGQLNLPASAIDGATSNGFMVSINYFTD